VAESLGQDPEDEKPWPYPPPPPPNLASLQYRGAWSELAEAQRAALEEMSPEECDADMHALDTKDPDFYRCDSVVD
jgi:hypothetical protein